MVAMTQDILVLILPYLSNQDASGLFEVILSKEVLTNQDNGVQKRGYKILAKLIELGKMPLDVEPVIERLDELSEGLTPAAKKVSPCFCPTSDRPLVLVLMYVSGSFSAVCEPTSFDPSFRFTCHPITDPGGCPWYKRAVGEGS